MLEIIKALNEVGIAVRQTFKDIPIYTYVSDRSSIQLADAGEKIVCQLVHNGAIVDLTYGKEVWCDMSECHVLDAFRADIKKECIACGYCPGGSCIMCPDFVDTEKYMPWLYEDQLDWNDGDMPF